MQESLNVDLPWLWNLHRGVAPEVCLPEWRQASAPACHPECLQWRRYGEHWFALHHSLELFHSWRMDTKSNKNNNTQFELNTLLSKFIFLLPCSSILFLILEDIKWKRNTTTQCRNQRKIGQRPSCAEYKGACSAAINCTTTKSYWKPAVRSSRTICRLHLKNYSGHKTGAYDSQCSLKLAPCCLNPCCPNMQYHFFHSPSSGEKAPSRKTPQDIKDIKWI